ncbi:MAG: hypothetical protein JST68_26050 [Bacteroidetes bacterium]|nr:hypothetical protein [Bacteroidota bacterium]
MKKLIIAATAFMISLHSMAQDNYDPSNDKTLIYDLFNICAVLMVIYLVSGLILKVIKHFLDHRLRNRIIAENTPENVVSQLLRDHNKIDRRDQALQWMLVLAGIGFGLAIINESRPYGIHSFAILAFCVAAGLGVYYFISKNKR